MDIPSRILEELVTISKIAGIESSWLVIKKQLLLSLPHDMRKLFSTRDAKTKKHTINIFEKELIALYEKMTGIKLELQSEQTR